MVEELLVQFLGGDDDDDSNWLDVDDENEEKQELCEIDLMNMRIVFIQRFGYAVKDFAKLFLDGYLDNDDDEDVVKTMYMKFLTNPSSEEQQTLSSTIKQRVAEIPEIDGLDHLVDIFARYFTCSCIVNDFHLTQQLVRVKDAASLKLLLKDAPPPKKWDETLRIVLAQPILEALHAGREL